MKTELSKKSKYYIPKERRLELAHFCMQYPDWVNKHIWLRFNPVSSSVNETGVHQANDADSTCDTASELAYLSYCMDTLSKTAHDTDPVIGDYIFQAAIRGVSYDSLNAYTQVPCCRNEFYELYRKFFWLLDQRLRYDLTQEA